MNPGLVRQKTFSKRGEVCREYRKVEAECQGKRGDLFKLPGTDPWKRGEGDYMYWSHSCGKTDKFYRAQILLRLGT